MPQELTTEKRLQREALQLQVRLSLGRAYAFVHSRSRVEQTLVRSIDDFKLAALEKIEGVDLTATFVRTSRGLSDIDRIEEIRQSIHDTVATIRANSEF